jgi:hypothetical protein
MRLALVALLAVLGPSGCAAPVAMQALDDEEVAACEASGGSVEPAYAINTYVCLSPNASERSDSLPTE